MWVVITTALARLAVNSNLVHRLIVIGYSWVFWSCCNLFQTGEQLVFTRLYDC